MKTMNKPVLADLSAQADTILLWDLWKTLARGTYPEPIADLQCLLGYKCCPKTGALKTPCPDFLRACLTTGEKDPRKYMDIIAGLFGLTVPADAYGKFETLITNERNGLCLFMDVEKELRFFHEKGFRQGLVSNVWPFPVHQLLDTTGIRGLFEHVILSCDVGVAKPDREIFTIAASKFAVPPGKCIMIGDNPTLDITGALAAGMKAVHIDRYGDCSQFVEGVPVIGNIRELYSD